MTQPITEVTYGTYQYFVREIGEVLGHGRDPNTWNHEKAAQIQSVLDRGLFQFYYPPPLPQIENRPAKAPHQWSFFFPTATLSLSADTAEYTLPNDFGGSIKEFIYASQDKTWKVAIVSPEALRQALDKGTLADLDEAVFDTSTSRNSQSGSSAPTGLPVAAAIEPKAHTGEQRQLHQAIFYPKPHKALTLTYRYQVQPQPLSGTNMWPHGTAVHTETILASCLAVILEKYGKGSASAKQAFFERLAASISQDFQAVATTGEIYPITHSDKGDLSIDYFYILRQVGMLKGYGWNFHSWSYEQRRDVDEIIESGLRKYYYPDPIDAMERGHQWSFLAPTGSIATSDGQRVYSLPPDFERFLGPLTFYGEDNNYYPPIDVTSDARLRALEHAADYTGPPQYAAVRPTPSNGKTPQLQELILHPTPDSTYNLSFRYYALQRKLSETNPFPLGGALHAEGILESCLATVELSRGEKNGAHFQAYQRRLVTNILADSRRAPQILGYNADVSTMSPVSRGDYQRLVLDRTITYNNEEWGG